MTPDPHPPPDGRVGGLVAAVKGLTFTNVAVIAALLMVAGPAYVVWRVLGDEVLINRFLSTYNELPSATNCILREAGERGGQIGYAIGTGFAYQGADRWQVLVVLDHRPTPEEETSYCETLKLLVDHMRERGDMPMDGFGPR